MEVFRLFGSVFVDNEKANKSLKATDSKAASVGKTFIKGIATVGKWGAAAGVAAGVVGGAMFKAASKIASATDEIDKMSQKIGISREAYQEWDFVLSQMGGDVSQLQTGIKTLSKASYEASQGVSTYKDNFDELNISVVDSNGNLKDQETLMMETITALQGMEDETKRTAIASELLGRSATELAPLLNAGAGATEELTQKAHDLGLIIGDETIDAGVSFTDSMDQMKRSMSALGVSMFSGLLPIFDKLMQWVIGKLPAVREKFEVVFGIVKNVVSTAIDVFNEYALPVLKKVKAYISENLVPIFEKMVDYIKENWPLIKEAFVIAFEEILRIAGDVWTYFSENILPIFVKVWELIRDNWPMLKDTFVNAFQSIWNIIQTVWDILDATLIPVLKSVVDYINDNWDSISKVFTDSFETIDDIINTVIDSVESLIGWLKDAIEWLGKFFTAKNEDGGTSSGVGGGSLGISGLDIDGTRASGGPVTAGKTYLVGEQGPELFTATQGGSITPNHSLSSGGVNIVVTGNTIIGDDDPAIDRIGEALVNRLRGLGVVTT